ncbi:MAG: glycine cleavage system aminomethyltransferase GcvT [Desulfurococcales archaeon]|nr:glycine cleavage system aminomethyltransferase GcvT [Desulfurococcales archaeon]
MAAPLKRIPLREFHVRQLGAQMGEFAGWEVPMLYESALKEHMVVRESVGVFDISHMGRLRVKGSHALDLLEAVFTKKVSKTRENHMSGPMLALNAWARVRDDEMAYRVSGDEWLLVPNAAYTEKMIEHLRSTARRLGLDDVVVEDLTREYAMIAVQGPRAVEVMEKVGASWAAELEPLEFRLEARVADAEAFLVSRSGWTGEDGFEIWARPPEMIKIYKALLGAGARPVGIISRDTLRIEMGFVLGGNEYGEDPRQWPCALSLRYGMGAIDWGKTGYEGYEALRACRREGVRWIRVGFVMRKKHARIVPRHGYSIIVEGERVGWVTSGAYSPVLGRSVGMGYIDVRYAIEDEPVEIEARGRKVEAKLRDPPFIEPKSLLKDKCARLATS